MLWQTQTIIGFPCCTGRQQADAKEDGWHCGQADEAACLSTQMRIIRIQIIHECKSAGKHFFCDVVNFGMMRKESPLVG
jgi:hypothetical protein